MISHFKKSLVGVAVLTAIPCFAFADDASQSTSTTVDLSFRYRIETVDQDNFSENANASTLRTRATVKTQWNPKFETLIEFDDVTFIGMEDFNAGQGNSPDKTQYPVVADPEGTEVNQALVRYHSDVGTLGYGRQRILIGNQRFVGGVGWRQNEQTFDSFTYKNKFGDLDFNYAYVFNVNRIFGEQVAAGDNKEQTHLINADYPLVNGKLSAYYFAIDNKSAPGAANNTLGVRYAGKLDNFDYNLEFATQSDAGDNPNDYSADYYLLEGNYHQENYAFGGAIETLGGDSANGQGFTTSLATGHAFQGWADLFLNTPSAGIEDIYINGSYQVNGYNFKVVYHNFSSDEGSVDYGTEWDLLVAKKVNNNLSALLKYADFSSDNAAYPSTSKMWLMLTYTM